MASNDSTTSSERFCLEQYSIPVILEQNEPEGEIWLSFFHGEGNGQRILTRQKFNFNLLHV